ncbi:hypothetical protein NDU88_012269 [Pleurodeles waltl]|uniref:Uncharacterized protein n=1 Tax=Pleurodeles waltl TaxID=8319 RepID=A0AAV7QZM8_PLEWA|nr:hypothetical protein NDU88_012269 [Pleurodeles waltl]
MELLYSYCQAKSDWNDEGESEHRDKNEIEEWDKFEDLFAPNGNYRKLLKLYVRKSRGVAAATRWAHTPGAMGVPRGEEGFQVKEDWSGNGSVAKKKCGPMAPEDGTKGKRAGQHGSADCQRMMNNFKELMKGMGIPLAEETTVGASTVLTFFGIEVDTVKMEARSPDEKKRVMIEVI